MPKDLRKFAMEHCTRLSNGKENPDQEFEPIVYTTKQLSQMLCMSEQSIRNLIKANNIPVIPSTKNVLVRKKTFDEFIAQY